MEPLYSICIGDLDIRPHEHAVQVGGAEVSLTFREFGIVLTLSEHPGWAYSLGQLASDADDVDYSPESVSVLVSRIRKKLSAAGASDVIETVRGVGYRLRSSAVKCDVVPQIAPGGADEGLRDAWWRLQEAVIEVQREGDAERQREVSDLLERTRRAFHVSLEE